MSEYIVEMRNITKRFPGIVANDNVTIQIKKGEIYALLGENGAGKSTLMSMLFGMYEPDDGEIYVVNYIKDEQLCRRIHSASEYFLAKVQDILSPVMEASAVTINNKAVKKQYGNALDSLRLSYSIKTGTLKTTLEYGFDVKRYVESKAKSSIDDEAGRKKKK